MFLTLTVSIHLCLDEHACWYEIWIIHLCWILKNGHPISFPTEKY